MDLIDFSFKKLRGDPRPLFTAEGSGEAGRGSAGLMRCGVPAAAAEAQGAAVGLFLRLTGERFSRQLQVLVGAGAARQGQDGTIYWLWYLKDLAALYGVLRLPSWQALADRFRHPDGRRISAQSLKNNVTSHFTEEGTLLTGELMDRLFEAGRNPPPDPKRR